MDGLLEKAAQAMRNKQQNIQIISNNLANVNTTGFKRGLAFSQVFDQENAKITKVVTDFSQGVFVQTQNPLNAAITGNSYFTVNTDEGEEITKNGDFVIDPQGFLSTRDGFRVLSQNGEINLQEELVDKSGSLSITTNGEIMSDDKIIAKLKIVNVEDQKSLRKTDGQKFYTDDHVYKASDEGSYEIHHGYLESSNTNAILEMQAMIQLQKDYEASQKMITSYDMIMSQQKELGKV